jgi:hypothetical protein
MFVNTPHYSKFLLVGVHGFFPSLLEGFYVKILYLHRDFLFILRYLLAMFIKSGIRACDMSSLKFDLSQLDYTTIFSLWQVKMRVILAEILIWMNLSRRIRQVQRKDLDR